MRYEEPRMEVLELEAEDIITLSNGGTSTGTGTTEGSTDMSSGYEW